MQWLHLPIDKRCCVFYVCKSCQRGPCSKDMLATVSGVGWHRSVVLYLIVVVNKSACMTRDALEANLVKKKLIEVSMSYMRRKDKAPQKGLAWV